MLHVLTSFQKCIVTELQCNLKAIFQLLQVLGAIWYLLSIQRQDSCWRQKCRNNTACAADAASLYCGAVHKNETYAFLKDVCLLGDPPNNLPDPVFGIYAPAIKNISQSRSFFTKLFYCVWWGLQNLRCSKDKPLIYLCSKPMCG